MTNYNDWAFRSMCLFIILSSPSYKFTENERRNISMLIEANSKEWEKTLANMETNAKNAEAQKKVLYNKALAGMRKYAKRGRKMANAKKCDICGKLYETPICNDVARIHLEFGYMGDRYVDLCDDCYGKLCGFVKPTLPEGYSVERRKQWNT